MDSPASLIDHTLLAPTATSEAVAALCEEAVEHGFAAVCIPPVFVSLAAERTYGSGVKVATVIGFPLGYADPAAKAAEAGRAAAAGAEELDMVIHLGAALEGRLDSVGEEIRKVVRAGEGARVKVILECCYLKESLKGELAERAVAAGAAFVKTSTGFGPGGATEADVRLLAAAVAGRIGVKAAGGIRDWPACRRMIEAGATRIGSSSGLAILEQWQREDRP